jgi:alkanesulfonate monooxygenase SsuD/methylene tetrahydromethanopterin reductase-like flavin-dependent oxidoreductase (luciferase family)
VRRRRPRSFDTGDQHVADGDGGEENIKPDQIPVEMRGRMLAGSPDYTADQVQAKVLGAGVDSVIIDLAAHGFTPGVITTAAEALRPLVGL